MTSVWQVVSRGGPRAGVVNNIFRLRSVTASAVIMSKATKTIAAAAIGIMVTSTAGAVIGRTVICV